MNAHKPFQTQFFPTSFVTSRYHAKYSLCGLAWKADFLNFGTEFNLLNPHSNIQFSLEFNGFDGPLKSNDTPPLGQLTFQGAAEFSDFPATSLPVPRGIYG